MNELKKNNKLNMFLLIISLFYTFLFWLIGNIEYREYGMNGLDVFIGRIILVLIFGFILGFIRISFAIKLVNSIFVFFIAILIFVMEDILKFGIYYLEGNIDYSRYEFNFNMVSWSFVVSFIFGQIVLRIYDKIRELKSKS